MEAINFLFRFKKLKLLPQLDKRDSIYLMVVKGIVKGVVKGLVKGVIKGVVKGGSKRSSKGVVKGVVKAVVKGVVVSYGFSPEMRHCVIDKV